jgi:hypothetical protein
VRLGIPGSALLKTLVDWEPRVGGTVTEYWNGRDEDNLINLWERNFATLITYYTLPASSVITYGNRDYDYRSYKGSINMPRPAKPARAYTNARQISPHFTRSRLTDRSFRARVSFPEADADESGGQPRGIASLGFVTDRLSY